ncbi:hypothetical protein GCM10025868_41930 [Angustibacter aerolatus]|uniref:Uncharacterized protein n=1 Tax=Angustibacter aerolatus TaxID=1162965 RepID=A0ABQ6JLR3_9ACTN|nr:hypothetical protein GCM10025868_41930 [Angustibacter aerolatus]
MLQAGVGVLRTLPAPTEEAIDRFRRQALALGAEWPQGQTYGGLLRSLDRDDPRHVALTHSATALFRGAGYTAFDGEPPAEASHAAVGAPYAHVTAPLRRLVDRFGLVVSEAVSRGAEVPAWTREALPDLPATMASSDRVASTVGRACTDAVEAAVLSGRVGETFDAVVVDRRDHGGVVQPARPRRRGQGRRRRRARQPVARAPDGRRRRGPHRPPRARPACLTLATLWRRVPPCRSEWRRVPPCRSEWRGVPPCRSEWRMVPPCRSEWRRVPPCRSEWRRVPPCRSEWHRVPPCRSEWRRVPPCRPCRRVPACRTEWRRVPPCRREVPPRRDRAGAASPRVALRPGAPQTVRRPVGGWPLR